jgi:hypothetical protein
MSLFAKAGLLAAIESYPVVSRSPDAVFFFAQPGLVAVGPCEMLRKDLASIRVRYYLGRRISIY